SQRNVACQFKARHALLARPVTALVGGHGREDFLGGRELVPELRQNIIAQYFCGLFSHSFEHRSARDVGQASWAPSRLLERQVDCWSAKSPEHGRPTWHIMTLQLTR